MLTPTGSAFHAAFQKVKIGDDYIWPIVEVFAHLGVFVNQSIKGHSCSPRKYVVRPMMSLTEARDVRALRTRSIASN